MNDQLNQQPISAQAEPAINQTPVATPPTKAGLKETLKEKFLKFKENKKLFYPLAIALSLLLVLIIIGSIYKIATGLKRTAKEATESIETPTQVVITSEEGLDEKMIKVLELETQINTNDVTQRRLSPPNVNFKLDF